MPNQPDLKDKLRDSYAPLLVRLNVDLDGQGVWADLPLDYFQGLTVTASTGAQKGTGPSQGGPWHGTLSLFERDPTAGVLGLFEAGILVPGNTRFRLQWCWDNKADAIDEAPLYEGILAKIGSVSYTAEGLGIELELIGTGFSGPSFTSLPQYNKEGGPRKWEEGRSLTAEEIVSEIATYYEAPYASQPSDGIVTPLRIAAGQSHLDFINKILVPKAHTSLGEGFVFYVSSSEAGYTDVWHFHAPSYAPQVHDEGGVVEPARTYVVYKDLSGEVISFTPEDVTAYLATAGGYDTKFAAVDSKGGEPMEATAKASDGVNHEGRGPYFAEDSNSTHDLKVRLESIHMTPLACRTVEQLLIYARTFHWRMRSAAIKAKLHVKGVHGISLMSVLDVRYYDATTVSKHYLSGLYTVYLQTHVVGHGGWTTEFDLLRPGFKDGGVPFVGSPQSQPTP